MAAALIFALLLHSGCGIRQHEPSFPPESLSGMNSIGISHARYTPRNNFDRVAKDWLPTAGKGALAGMSGCLDVGATSPEASVLAMVVFPACAIVGAVAGGAQTMPKEKQAEISKAVENAVAALDMNKALSSRFFEMAPEAGNYKFEAVGGIGPASAADKPDYKALAGRGIDTVIEITVSDVGFRGDKSYVYPPIALYLTADVRIVRASDGMELHAQKFHYLSATKKLDWWASDNAARFKDELEHAYAAMARAIVDMLTPVVVLDKDRYCGLLPTLPADARYGMREPTITNSLEPTLQWEPFPRQADIDSGAVKGTVSDVVYDIKIWKFEETASKPVYEEYGIKAASHRVEPGIEPGSRYYWTVRARYKVNAKTEATNWSYRKPPGQCLKSYEERLVQFWPFFYTPR